MPKGPNGQKRPGDVIGAAVMVARIATGEIEETPSTRAAKSRGGKARASSMSPERRAEVAKKAADARWKAAEVAPGKRQPQES